MDLPPSGWYPDPYGVPGLLRWWDGSRWTQHTHQGAGTEAAGAAEPAATAQPTTVQPAVQPTSVQPSAVQPSSVQPTTVQPAVRPSTVQPTTVQPTTVQPPVQPTTVQPTTVQPTTVQPAGARPAPARPGGTPSPQGADAQGTQVLFLGDDAWTTPGGPQQGDRDGYRRAQRRRRTWLMSGLAGGTVVALALIGLVVHNLGRTPTTPLADQTPTTPAASPTPTTPSPSPSPTSSAGPVSLVEDGTSGLSYTQLPNPWGPNCPTGLNSTFPWAAGESAIAGQVNDGQTTWYGVACSGALPQSYGYSGVADLENTATTLENQFTGSYYNNLQHNSQVEVSTPLTVSGHAGWEIKFLMTYPTAQSQGLQWQDELGAVVVADLGTGIEPAVFYVSVPGNLNENNVDALVSSLKLTVPQQPGGGGSPGDGSPAAGSPAAGSPNP